MAHFRVRQPLRGISLAPIGGIVLWLGMLGFALLLVMAMEDVTGSKETAKLEEAKQNLHSIQLSVERFWVDNEVYPDYLSGGSRYISRQVNESAERPFKEVRVIDDLTQVPDPLIRQGYLDYPRNPFVKGDQAACLAIHRMQISIPGTGGADPLRNGDNSMGGIGGARFGASCSTMGQVLADARYPQISYTPDEIAAGGPYPSYSASGYPFWDIYAGDKPKPYLPGEFFYKSCGVVLSADAAASATEPVRPVKSDGYVMGLYGAASDKGRDVIGPEPQVQGFVKATGNTYAPDAASVKVWPWTRSVADPTTYDGSPFSVLYAPPDQQLVYGNPNGIRDAIALVLTAGRDIE